jgi:hypothetical protein
MSERDSMEKIRQFDLREQVKQGIDEYDKELKERVAELIFKYLTIRLKDNK